MDRQRLDLVSVPAALLILAFAADSAHAARLTPSSARVRHMVCRGKAGIDLRMERDPSPRDSRAVAMVLRYARSTRTPGADFSNLDPGTCSWNPGGYSDVPPEPGIVQFDVPLGWLAPGEYAIELNAKSAAGAAKEVVRFKVTG